MRPSPRRDGIDVGAGSSVAGITRTIHLYA